MKKRVLSLAAAVAVCALVTFASAVAQSLGDLAKQEEARRKTIRTPGKVYTNETVRSDAGRPAPPVSSATASTAPLPAASASAPPSTSGQPPAAQTPGQAPAAPAPAAPDPKQDEAAWRKRIQNERDLLQRAQMFADALQSRINSLSTDFVNRDDPAQRAVIGADRQKALAELDRVKQEIQQHTKAVSAIQEEARKAGVPPGWVR
jgi:hypothetical protein